MSETKTWDTALKLATIAVAVLIPCVGFMVSKVFNLNDRVVAIEANRFTAADGDRLKEFMSVHQQDSVERYAAIQVSLEQIQARVAATE